jgi:hypothetical protein
MHVLKCAIFGVKGTYWCPCLWRYNMMYLNIANHHAFLHLFLSLYLTFDQKCHTPKNEPTTPNTLKSHINCQIFKYPIRGSCGDFKLNVLGKNITFG